MKGILAILCAAALLLCGCSRETPVPASELDLWVTSQERGETYQALAESWNRDHPQEPIQLRVSVYSSQSISSKFSWGLSAVSGFHDGDVPDLLELDYGAFPEFVFQQTADLYPLQNMMTVHEGQTAGARMYSKNGISFALPYRDQQLVLCYRLDLMEQFPEFSWEKASFEGLLELGKTYAGQQGEGLLWVDYLGSETFLALYLQAQEREESDAYDRVIQFLKEAQSSGAWDMLPSGDAYSQSLLSLLTEAAVPCFITTQDNLRSLARQDSRVAESYGVASLPSFEGNSYRVDAPTVAVAVHISGSDPVLSREFLEYCRFSETAKAYPTFYLGPDGAETGDLSDVYPLFSQSVEEMAGEELTAMDLAPYLAEYSHLVLGE